MLPPYDGVVVSSAQWRWNPWHLMSTAANWLTSRRSLAINENSPCCGMHQGLMPQATEG